MPLATKRNGLIAGAGLVAVALIVGLGAGLGTRKNGAPAQAEGQASSTANNALARPVAKPLSAAAPSLAPAPTQHHAAAAPAHPPAHAPAGDVLVRPGEEDALSPSGSVAITPEQAYRMAMAGGASPQEAQEAAERAALAASNRISGRPVPGSVQAPPPPPHVSEEAEAPWAREALEQLHQSAPGPLSALDDPSLYGNVSAANAQNFKGPPIDCVRQGATTFVNDGPCMALSNYYHPLAPQIVQGNSNVLRSIAAAAPTPSDECCVEMRKFIEHGCSCDPPVLAAIPAAGFGVREVMIGMGILQLSQCASPANGGPIFNPCTMTIGRQYLNEDAESPSGVRRMLA